METGATVDITMENGCMHCSIKGEIDHHSAKTMRETIDKQLADTMPDALVLHMSQISFMDSSGLGLVLGRYQKATEGGMLFRIEGTSPVVRRMFDMAGLSRIIEYGDK